MAHYCFWFNAPCLEKVDKSDLKRSTQWLAESWHVDVALLHPREHFLGQ
jgi:hypothetical protein